MAKRKPLNVTPKEETRAPDPADKKVTGQATRKGQVTLVTYTDPAVKKQLKLIALEQDTTQAELFREAINDLFRKNGKPPIM